MKFDYNDKTFRSLSNSETGEVVHGIYQGGEIVYGTIIAKAGQNGVLDMRYQHINRQGELKTGICTSTPEFLEDGRIRLNEKWQWTCDNNESGESVVEEVKEQ